MGANMSVPWTGLQFYRLTERLEYRSFDQALRDIDFVRIQAHRPRHRPNLGRGLLGGRLDVLAFQGVLDNLGAVGQRRYATERNPTVLPIGAIQRKYRRDRD